MCFTRWLLALLFYLVIPFACIAQTNTSASTTPTTPTLETPEQKAGRMAWWRDARFGMFIHWDMSSVEGREISWSRVATKPLDAGSGPKSSFICSAGQLSGHSIFPASKEKLLQAAF